MASDRRLGQNRFTKSVFPTGPSCSCKLGLGWKEPGLGLNEPGLGLNEPGLGLNEPGLGWNQPDLGGRRVMGEREPVADRDGIIVGEDAVARCWWADSTADYRAYHDAEWGFPVSDDMRLFEKLSLEGFQAGLSWLTILRKRPAFRKAFAGFQFERVAHFGERDVARLLADPGIVRHRGKIEAVINNARRAVELVEDEGSLAHYVWRFEPPARTLLLDRSALAQLAVTAESSALAKDMKRRGWRFVGPTTVYAFMQAMGLVNDHLDGCDTRAAVEAARRDFDRP